MNYKISSSLVIFNAKPDSYIPAINSFFNSVKDGFLVISDNSDKPLTHPLLNDFRIKYIFNGKNLGFGAAHNVAMRICYGSSDFHLILNPDIIFSHNVLNSLVFTLANQPHAGAVMPRIEYPNGSLQRLCKLLPTPAHLFVRRFLPLKFLQHYINAEYELVNLPQDVVSEVPTISGCFLLSKTSILERLGGFDERYFMYLEDVDLVRRIGVSSKILYDPCVFVVHSYAKGSYRKNRLLFYHIISSIRYFNKWGWLYDPYRAKLNKQTLKKLGFLKSKAF